MSFTPLSTRDARQKRSDAKPQTPAKAVSRYWEIDKVTALALLASAILAPVAVAI